MKSWFRFFIVFLACTMVSCFSMAQTTRGDIQGRVIDQAGVPLPGVTVTIQSDNLIGTQSAVTDGNGLYKFLVLPPGDYELTFNLSGFQTREQGGVAVKIGSTARVDVTLSSAFTDELVVTSQAPLVDTAQTTIGVDVDQEFFQDLPVGRNYAAVAAITPGAQTDDSGTEGANSGQTFYGSTGSENAYYIDGANTTGVELGQQGKTLNFEFIQEVQVKTGSYSAEYGRATGAVVNVITKSGGNEYHGDVFGYWDDSSMQAGLSSEAAEGAVSGSFKRTDFTRSDYGIDVGGYIVKDSLWFFAAYDRVDNEDRLESLGDFSEYVPGAPYQGQQFIRTTDADLWAAKLTWSIASNHTISGSAFGDPRQDVGVLPSSADFTLAGPEQHYTGVVERGGTDYSLNYDGVFGANVVLSARIAQHNEESNQLGPGHNATGLLDYTDPSGTGTTIAGWDDATSGESGFWFHQNQEFSRDQYNIDLSYFVADLAGSHEFKIGYEFEEIGVVNNNWNGGGGQRIYRFLCEDSDTRDCHGSDYYFNHRIYVTSGDLDPTQLTVADIQAPLSIDTKSENEAFFIQDTWQVLDNLTLNLGYRFGEQILFNADGEPHAPIKGNNAPRVGFVWDFMGNGKSKAYGHWGRFYETIPMDIVIRSFGGEIEIFSYNTSDDPADVANDPTVRPSRIRGGGYSRVDDNTRGQYIEETVLGVEYEVAQDWAVGVKYIVRDLGRVIEDALTLDGDYFIGNPSEGSMTQTYSMGTAWGYNDAGPRDVPAPVREFEGVELTVTKRFSNNFQFIASALFSDLVGNYDGTFQASTGQLDPNLNSAYDYADFQVNNYGKLSNDIPFQFKFDGVYRFDFGLTAGLSAYYRQGTPITAMGYEVNYNNYEYYLSERGAFGRVDDQYEADLHFGYPVQLGGTMELNLLVDIFNVLDRQGETRRSLTYTDQNTVYFPVDWDTDIDNPPITPGDTSRPPTDPSWNTATRWQNPRTIRFGARFSF